MSGSVKLTESSKFTDATRQYAARVVATGGGVSASSLRAMDNHLIKPLQCSGLWGQIVMLSPCLGINLSSSLVRLIGGGSDTNHNLLESDYSESLGWQTDGSTKYLDTGYNAGATGGMGAYLRTTQTSNTTAYILMGASNTGATDIFRIVANRDTAGSATSGAMAANWGGTAALNSTGSSSGGLLAGFWHTSRQSSISIRMYKRGTSVGAANTTSLTPIAPGASLTVMANNVQITGVGSYLLSGSRVSGYSIDSGLSPSDSMTLAQIWQDFQRKMNRSV